MLMAVCSMSGGDVGNAAASAQRRSELARQEALAGGADSAVGSRLSARLSRSSGGAAALRVLARSDPFPRDENGKGPDSFIITFRPND